MDNKVYIVHERNDWKERYSIYGVYSSREKAIADLKEDYDDLSYNGRIGRWERDADDTYFRIQEVTVQ